MSWFTDLFAPKKEFTIRFPDKIVKRIEALRDEEGTMSLSSHVREALALYELAIENKREGARLYIRHSDGSESEVLLDAFESKPKLRLVVDNTRKDPE